MAVGRGWPPAAEVALRRSRPPRRTRWGGPGRLLPGLAAACVRFRSGAGRELGLDARGRRQPARLVRVDSAASGAAGQGAAHRRGAAADAGDHRGGGRARGARHRAGPHAQRRRRRRRAGQQGRRQGRDQRVERRDAEQGAASKETTRARAHGGDRRPQGPVRGAGSAGEDTAEQRRDGRRGRRRGRRRGAARGRRRGVDVQGRPGVLDRAAQGVEVPVHELPRATGSPGPTGRSCSSPGRPRPRATRWRDWKNQERYMVRSQYTRRSA